MNNYYFVSSNDVGINLVLKKLERSQSAKINGKQRVESRKTWMNIFSFCISVSNVTCSNLQLQEKTWNLTGFCSATLYGEASYGNCYWDIERNNNVLLFFVTIKLTLSQHFISIYLLYKRSTVWTKSSTQVVNDESEWDS